jgi:predicted nucleotidyltransferase
MDKREAVMAAQRYVNTISGKYPLSRAFVFGSYVKGKQHSGSDIDVAIVMREISNLFDMQVNLMQLRSDNDLQIEPHAFRENDFDSDDPFVYEILQDGIELSVLRVENGQP